MGLYEKKIPFLVFRLPVLGDRITPPRDGQRGDILTNRKICIPYERACDSLCFFVQHHTIFTEISNQSSCFPHSNLISSAGSTRHILPSSSSHSCRKTVFSQSSHCSAQNGSSSPGLRGSGFSSISHLSRNTGYLPSQRGRAPVDDSPYLVRSRVYEMLESDRSWWVSANGRGGTRGRDGKSVPRLPEAPSMLPKFPARLQPHPYRSHRVYKRPVTAKTSYPRLLHLRVRSYTLRRRSRPPRRSSRK